MFIRKFFQFKFKGTVLFNFLAILIFFHQHLYGQKAARFYDTGDYVEIPHHTSLAPSQLTVEFWLKVHDFENMPRYDQQTVLDKRGNDTPGYVIYLSGDQFPVMMFATLNPNDILISGAIYPNTWYHIAITQDADSARSYLDGRLKRTTWNNYTSNTITPLRIADFLGYPNDTSSFIGEIDEVRIWNYSRSQEEIEAAMYEEMKGDEAGLAAYWDFDSLSGPFVSDLTVNGNDGIMHGNATLVDSDAPFISDASPAPVGLRAHGGEGKIDLVWKAGDSSVFAYALYRGDSRFFLPETNTLIAIIEAPATSFTDTDVVKGKNYYYQLRAIDKYDFPGRAGKPAMGRTFTMQGDYMTGVHYFQWYGSPEDLAHHINGESLRSLLIPEQPPMLGYYSSRDPSVIRQHLKWMQSFGIDFITLLWDRDNTWEKTTLIDYILPVIAGSNIKFMVEYGPHSLVTDFFDAPVIIDSELEERLVNDFIETAGDYFDHPNYLTIDSSYAVYLYISRLFAGDYVQAFERARSELKSKGYNLYLIGDEMAFNDLNEHHMQFVDAISPYVVWTGYHDGYPIETDFFADLSMQASLWEDVTKPSGIPIIPNATMGLNKRWEDPTVITLPPQSTAGAVSTSTLEEYIKAMLPFIDPQLNMILITAWNEWHEDTILEPIVITPPTSADVSETGSFYTQGYLYEGHGFKPLEVVRNLLATDMVQPTIDHFNYTETNEITYSISVSGALVDGELLEPGDEIGVFDGEVCVGATAVTNNWPVGFWAWADKSETEITEGFTNGNRMSFRIWDASSSQKFTTIPSFEKGNGEFGTGAYSQITLESDRILLESNVVAQVILATDADTIAFAFDGGGGISIIFTGGNVAGKTVWVEWMNIPPQELPETAAFKNPIYYLDLKTDAEDYNITLLFEYTESQLLAKGILESELDVKIWVTDKNIWESVPVIIDSTENSVNVSTDHPSLWALTSNNEVIISGSQQDASSAILPDKFFLEQNYPNPFRYSTSINYTLANPGNVSLKIFDLYGRLVDNLVDKFHTPGKYQATWTTEGVPSGMYFYKMQSSGLSETRKLIIRK